MTILINIAIYLIGYILAYLIFRMEDRKEDPIYTVGHRLKNLTPSLFSWFIVFGFIYSYIYDALQGLDIDKSKPAKW
jgi:hypothetical protein